MPTPARIVVADSGAAMADAIGSEWPAVVVNLLGGYAESAAMLAGACLPGGHYLDLANDLTSMTAMLELRDDVGRVRG